MGELETKLEAIRGALARAGLRGVRLRGNDWFAWATCGGSSAVLLASESGVAEVLVTADGAWVLTDVIEAARLEAEELPDGIDVWAGPWESPAEREAFVADRCGGGPIGSDRAAADEAALPAELVRRRWSLLPEELDRYRALGRDAAAAATETLARAERGWTELDLAGAGAQALLHRAIDPALILVAGERRLPLYRHATPSHDALGGRAMMVLSARRHGLHANLTRFVCFRPPTTAEERLARDAAQVEAAAFRASRPGATLGEVLAEIVGAYAAVGHPGAERLHHQGGSCGYLSRDVVARPGAPERIEPANALAWNPSLPGAKIEDTVVAADAGVEILTVDPAWPAVEIEGRARPAVLVR